MPRLITVAIPSFNRSAKLDRQLAWLLSESAGFESDVEVIVSDNASPDDTPEVCARRQKDFESIGVRFRINRNPQNVGPLPNISRCIEMAETRFVWVIGDDDEIPAGKLHWVIAQLQADPELASIIMNFKGVGTTVYARCFNFSEDQRGEGVQIIEQCLRQAYFGLAFMSAQVYRTEYVQAGLKTWTEGRTNYDYQVFLTAYTGRRGRVLATRDTHLTYVTGDNVYEKDMRIGMILYADTLEVFLQLCRIGFAGSLCRRLAIKHVWGLKKRFLKCAIKNSPWLTIATILRVLRRCVALGFCG